MQIGHVVGERFRLEAFVGQGGMARVFRALDLASNQPVAIKVLLDKEEANRERFAREAEVLAKLQHPNIVAYIAHGETETNAWIAMEWLGGEALNRRMGKPMAIADAVIVFSRIAQAPSTRHHSPRSSPRKHHSHRRRHPKTKAARLRYRPHRRRKTRFPLTRSPPQR